MDEVTRRQALGTLVALGTVGIAPSVVAPATAVAAQDAASESPHRWSDSELRDRRNCVDAGMSEAEADCWELFVRAGAAFFALPKLHPAADAEFAAAMHVIQKELLSRPTYRRYLEVSRGAK